MQLIYVEHLNGYIDLESKYYPGDVYTEEDLDLFLELESFYRKNLPEHNFYELIKIYPSAKNAMKKSIVAREKALKDKKRRFIAYQDQQINIFGKLNSTQQIQIKDELEKENDIRMKEFSREEQRLKFQKDYINRLLKEESVRKKIEKAKKKSNEQEILQAEKELENISYQSQEGITNAMIERAKSVPITNFVSVGRDGKVKCLKHNEKTPSMHIYRKKNNFYCFSCGFHGSVIDYIMETQGLNFKDAVKYLNNA